MPSYSSHLASIIRVSFRASLISVLILVGVLQCKPAEQDADLGFWAVVAWARSIGLTKPSSVNECVGEENCINQTEGDFKPARSLDYQGSCNLASVSLCINLPAFGQAAQFCERSDGELKLEQCPALNDELPAVGTCVFHRGQAVFYPPLYTAENSPTLCENVYKGVFQPGYVP